MPCAHQSICWRAMRHCRVGLTECPCCWPDHQKCMPEAVKKAFLCVRHLVSLLCRGQVPLCQPALHPLNCGRKPKPKGSVSTLMHVEGICKPSAGAGSSAIEDTHQVIVPGEILENNVITNL